MKKTIIALFALISIGFAAEGRNMNVTKFVTSGGVTHSDGSTTYDYISMSSPQTTTLSNGDRITRRILTCEDPGSNACINSFIVTPITYADAEMVARQKIAMGIPAGEYNPNGTPNDGDPYNQNLLVNPYFTWQATGPDGLIIEVYYEGGE